MGDDQLGDVEAEQRLRQVVTARRVQVRGRLVEHEDLGLHRHHSGHRHPSLLSVGEVVRRPVGEVGDLE